MKVIINNAELAKLLGVKAGDSYEVESQDGVPTTREWRNRFKDSEIDNCISLDVPKKDAK